MGSVTRAAPTLGLVMVVLILGAGGKFHAWLGMSPASGVALTLLLVAAVLWISELVPLFVTSVLILFLNVVWVVPALKADGINVGAADFMAPFFSDVILLFLGGFVLSAAFQRYSVDERIAQWVLRRTGTAPPMVLVGIMMTTAFLSMWMSNTATTAMMLGLARPVLAGVRVDDPFRKAIGLGIPFAANLGGLGTPIGTPPNAIAVQFMNESGSAPSFATWIAMAAPMLLVLLALAWGLLLRLYPARVDVVDLPDERGVEPGLNSRLVVVIALLTIGGWLTSSLHGLSTGVVALVPVMTFYGLRILNPEDFRRLPWDVLILAGGGLSLGVAVSTSGLAEWAARLVPVEQAPPFVVALGFGLIAGLMSTFMSNTATANLLIPVVIGMPGHLEGPLLCVVAFSCSVSMALPITTPPNAMAFSSGNITVKDMVGPGAILTLVGIAAAVASVSWWKALGAV